MTARHCGRGHGSGWTAGCLPPLHTEATNSEINGNLVLRLNITSQAKPEKQKLNYFPKSSIFFLSHHVTWLTPGHSSDLSSVVTSSMKPFLVFLPKSHICSPCASAPHTAHWGTCQGCGFQLRVWGLDGCQSPQEKPSSSTAGIATVCSTPSFPISSPGAGIQ